MSCHKLDELISFQKKIGTAIYFAKQTVSVYSVKAINEIKFFLSLFSSPNVVKILTVFQTK